MPMRPHELLAFLIELEDDDERAPALRNGFELLRAAHRAGRADWARPDTLDDIARAVDRLRLERLVELDDLQAQYRSPHQPFLGNELGNSRDIRVTQAGRAHHALLQGSGASRRVEPDARPSQGKRWNEHSIDDRDFFTSPRTRGCSIGAPSACSCRCSEIAASTRSRLRTWPMSSRRSPRRERLARPFARASSRSG